MAGKSAKRISANQARAWAAGLSPAERTQFLAEGRDRLRKVQAMARAGSKKAEAKARQLQRKMDACRKVIRGLTEAAAGRDDGPALVPPHAGVPLAPPGSPPGGAFHCPPDGATFGLDL